MIYTTTNPDLAALRKALDFIRITIPNALPAEVVEHAFATGLIDRPKYYTADRTIARFVRIVELLMRQPELSNTYR